MNEEKNKNNSKTEKPPPPPPTPPPSGGMISTYSEAEPGTTININEIEKKEENKK